MNDSELARNWAMGCHLAALAFYIGIPLGNILGPLIIWLIKKNEYELVDEQGKEVLNFQISVIIYSIVGAILAVIFAVTVGLIPLAVIIGIAIALLFLADLVITIIAAVKVANGESFYYPLTLRLIK